MVLWSECKGMCLMSKKNIIKMWTWWGLEYIREIGSNQICWESYQARTTPSLMGNLAYMVCVVTNMSYGYGMCIYEGHHQVCKLMAHLCMHIYERTFPGSICMMMDTLTDSVVMLIFRLNYAQQDDPQTKRSYLTEIRKISQFRNWLTRVYTSSRDTKQLVISSKVGNKSSVKFW